MDRENKKKKIEREIGERKQQEKAEKENSEKKIVKEIRR